MMEEIGAVDAKAHFSQILNAVEQGKSVVITRHGRKIAILKPISHSDEESNRFERAKKAIRNMRQGVTLGPDLSIKNLIEEGRR